MNIDFKMDNEDSDTIIFEDSVTVNSSSIHY